jgi:hypothetical protein
MAKYEVIQGNSLWLDVEGDTAIILAADPVWENYTGVWDISASITGVAILSGTLTRSATPGIFRMTIGPVSGGVPWTTLTVGNYFIRYQIVNAGIDYLEELRDNLKIIAQGIT